KLWQRRFRARSLHVFAVDRICDYGGIGAAAIAVHQAMECSGRAGVRGSRAVRCYVCASLAQQVYWGSDLLLLVRGQSLYPGNPYAVAGLAKEYSQRGAHDRAIELAQSVVKDHPEYDYGPLALAEAYIRAGRFEEGRVWLERVNPDYAESEVGMAGVAGLYGQMGDYERAFALCSQILEKEP